MGVRQNNNYMAWGTMVGSGGLSRNEMTAPVQKRASESRLGRMKPHRVVPPGPSWGGSTQRTPVSAVRVRTSYYNAVSL